MIELPVSAVIRASAEGSANRADTVGSLDSKPI